MGQGYCGRFGGSGVRRHVSALPSVPTLLVPRQENVDNGQAGEVGAVLDRIHPGYGPPSLQEHVCLGPHAQLRSVHGLGVPPQLHPEVIRKVPQALNMDPPQPLTTLTR